VKVRALADSAVSIRSIEDHVMLHNIPYDPGMVLWRWTPLTEKAEALMEEALEPFW
jgi:hypothetical protein